jgi:hypothetical protein
MHDWLTFELQRRVNFALGHLAADSVAHIVHEEVASHDTRGWTDWSRAISADPPRGAIS